MSRWFSTLFLSGSLFVQMVPARSISGLLANSEQAPLHGWPLLLLQAGKPVAKTVTDASGRFRFENLEDGEYTLKLQSLGLAAGAWEVSLAAGVPVERQFTLDQPLVQEEVVVTATRTEVSRRLLGNSVTVINREEMEAQKALTVAEVLRNVPGLHVVQAGGHGAIGSLFLRGGESDYTKILLDGIPLNEPGGAVDLTTLSTANLERVEVVRGPQSALYGSDAISGVVQLFTRRGRSETAHPEIDLLLEGGSHDTGRAGMHVGGEVGRLNYSAAFQHLSTDNRLENEYFRHNSWSGRLEVRTGESSSLSLVGRAERGRLGVPGQAGFGLVDREEYARRRNFAFGAIWNQRLHDLWEHRVSYSQSSVSQLSVDPADSGVQTPRYRGREAPFPAFDFVFSNLNAPRRHTLNYQSDFLLSGHLVSAGLEWEQERGVTGEVRAQRDNAGYYVQDQFMWGERLSLAGGFRVDDNEHFGTALSPRASLAYLLRRGEPGGNWGMTRAKINAARGIKEPTLIESFSTNLFFLGNPDLKPERADSYEIGLEQILLDNRLQVELSTFHNRFRDQIAFQVVDFKTFEGSFFNLADSRAWGVEHVVRAVPRRDISMTLGYTYLNSRVLKSASPFNDVFREGARLLRRPTHSGFIDVSWRRGRWTLNSNATLAGERADSDFRGLGLLTSEGFVKWDLTGSYRLTPRVEIYTAFENLLNQDYFEALGFPSPKFHFRSGLRVSVF